jgi:serine/threonine protein kinase
MTDKNLITEELIIGKRIAYSYSDQIYEATYKGQKYMVQKTRHNNKYPNEFIEQYYDKLVGTMKTYGCQSDKLVSYIDTIEDQGYIIMEYGGVTLKELLESEYGGMFVKRNSIEIIKQLADCLLAIEEMGIYHKFLKPENIWIKDSICCVNNIDCYHGMHHFHSGKIEVRVSDYGLNYNDRHYFLWATTAHRYSKYSSPQFYWLPEPPYSKNKDKQEGREDVWVFALMIYNIMIEPATTIHFHYSSLDHYTRWLLYPSTPVVISRCGYIDVNGLILMDIMKRCLTWPDYRPSMKDIHALVCQLK